MLSAIKAADHRNTAQPGSSASWSILRGAPEKTQAALRPIEGLIAAPVPGPLGGGRGRQRVKPAACPDSYCLQAAPAAADGDEIAWLPPASGEA